MFAEDIIWSINLETKRSTAPLKALTQNLQGAEKVVKRLGNGVEIVTGVAAKSTQDWTGQVKQLGQGYQKNEVVIVKTTTAASRTTKTATKETGKWYESVKGVGKELAGLLKTYATIEAADRLMNWKPIKLAVEHAQRQAELNQVLRGTRTEMMILGSTAEGLRGKFGMTTEQAYSFARLAGELNTMTLNATGTPGFYNEWSSAAIYFAQATGIATDAAGRFLYRMGKIHKLSTEEDAGGKGLWRLGAGFKYIGDQSSIAHDSLLNIDQSMEDFIYLTDKSGRSLETYTLKVAALQGKFADYNTEMTKLMPMMEKMLDTTSEEGRRAVHLMSVYSGRSIEELRSMITESPEDFVGVVKSTLDRFPSIATHMGKVYRNVLSENLGITRTELLKIERMTSEELTSFVDKAVEASGKGSKKLTSDAHATRTKFLDEYTRLQISLEKSQEKIGKAVLPAVHQYLVPAMKEAEKFIREHSSELADLIGKGIEMTANLPLKLIEGVAAVGKSIDEVTTKIQNLTVDDVTKAFEGIAPGIGAAVKEGVITGFDEAFKYLSKEFPSVFGGYKSAEKITVDTVSPIVKKGKTLGDVVAQKVSEGADRLLTGKGKTPGQNELLEVLVGMLPIIRTLTSPGTEEDKVALENERQLNKRLDEAYHKPEQGLYSLKRRALRLPDTEMYEEPVGEDGGFMSHFDLTDTDPHPSMERAIHRQRYPGEKEDPFTVTDQLLFRHIWDRDSIAYSEKHLGPRAAELKRKMESTRRVGSEAEMKQATEDLIEERHWKERAKHQILNTGPQSRVEINDERMLSMLSGIHYVLTEIAKRNGFDVAPTPRTARFQPEYRSMAG